MQRSQQVFNIQELERVLAATLRNVNADGMSTGINDVHIFRFLYAFPGMEAYVGSEYYHFIAAKLAEAEREQHARAQVTALQMYPRAPRDYPPWETFDVPSNAHLIQAHEAAKSARFQFALVDGKVYARHVHGVSVVDAFYDSVISPQWEPDLRRNSEACHITLVGSPVVHKLGAEVVGAFVAEYVTTKCPEAFGVDTGVIKETFSEDWARFSRCVVVSVSSTHVNEFLAAFNARFGTALKPAPHITFAVRPRDLFPMSAR